MTDIRLTPEETADFLDAARFVDGFVEGARALAERMKRRKMDQIIASRAKKAPMPAPEPGKE